MTDPGGFTIPCLIGNLSVSNALADLGASINLIPYVVFAKLGIGEPKPTRMSIQLADRSIKYTQGIVKNMLVKIDKFVFPVDFVILDMEEDKSVPLILGRPFLATAKAIIDVCIGKLTLRVNDEAITFDIGKSMQYPQQHDDTLYCVDIIDSVVSCYMRDSSINTPLEIQVLDKTLNKPILENENLNNNHQEESEIICEIIENNEKSKPSIEEPPALELKELPKHLKYAFLEKDSQLPVIISSHFSKEEKDELLKVLKNHKKAIAWKIMDIKGISPSFCTHKILMEEEYKPVVQHQRRLNPNMQDVVKKEVIKLLDAGLIYSISDSPWVSPVQGVPKKGGMTVVMNEKDELIPMRTITGWRVCIDYRKLNDATRKDHFPLPFIDQMLERLSGKMVYCFLDGFSGYFQIPIAPEDQEKTTFTCPYGTFVYRRMPFGLYFHAFLVFGNHKKKDQLANERLTYLNNRYSEAHFRACEDTVRNVNQWDRYQIIVRGPWRRVFNQTGDSVTELTKEFLASFNFKKKKFDMWDTKAIEFRCGGVWHTTSVTQLGIDLGIYTGEETDTDIWFEAKTTFTDEGDDDEAVAGAIKEEAWEQLSYGTITYMPSVSKSTALRDPLMRWFSKLAQVCGDSMTRTTKCGTQKTR
ncbi:uncharacterized protein LOC143587593 [Bidens hawaiensis]|uniref:uncharacterized protein LOC143587593 n=1 Tax=Bidens hawaiensis TaxID=980011 RepID=UPI00404AF589